MTSTPEPAESTDSTESTDAGAVVPSDASEQPQALHLQSERPEGDLTELTPASAHVTDEGAQAEAAPTPAEPQTRPQPVPATPTPEELDLAAAALHDVTPRGAVGHVLDALLEGGDGEQAQVLAIRHISTLPGYPDWTWTVLLSRGVEGGPTVLEVALLPGEGSLLAPAWVPWSERLADYLAAKESAGADGEAGDEDDEELDSDLESDLEDDFDDDFVEDDEDDEDDDSDGWGAAAESDAEPDDARG